MLASKNIAILNTSAPFATNNAKDAQDVALIMGSYEQQVHLYFKGDGVWQLVGNQSPEQIQVKDFLKTFSAYEFYDLTNIYVCEKSLKERKLLADFHIDDVTLLSPEQFSQQLHQHEIILTF